MNTETFRETFNKRALKYLKNIIQFVTNSKRSISSCIYLSLSV